jgi:hypothetical protein
MNDMFSEYWVFDPADIIEMADQLGCTPNQLIKVFKRFDIETRDAS